MLKGRISLAVEIVNRLYPSLLHNNKELMFRVLCRQFIEVVSGFDKMADRGGETNGDMGEDEVAMDTDGGSVDENVDQSQHDGDDDGLGECMDYTTGCLHVWILCV